MLSCSLERKVLNSYLKYNDEISILILEPETIFKTNLKVKLREDYALLNDYEKDSLASAESIFFQYLEDSITIQFFANELIAGLSKYPNLKIYTKENMGDFLQKGNKGYIFNFAQIDFEEYYNTFKDSAYFDDYKYIKEVERNGVSLNFYVEITPTNQSDDKMQIAFTAVHSFDQVAGSFDYNIFSGEVEYPFLLIPMDSTTIKEMIAFAALKNASLMHNFMLNHYLSSVLKPRATGETVYFTFDLKTKRLVRIYYDQQRFSYFFLKK